MLKVDGYDDCVIGVGSSCGGVDKLVYNSEKMIQKMVEEGMSEEEAWEFFDFNILGAYVGETTPTFVRVKPDTEELEAWLEENGYIDEEPAEGENG